MHIPAPTPTPMSEFEDRRARVRAAMDDDGLDLLVCYGDAWRTANIRYFTDFRPVDGINGIEQAVLLFPLTAEPQLFVADGCLDAARSGPRSASVRWASWAPSRRPPVAHRDAARWPSPGPARCPARSDMPRASWTVTATLRRASSPAPRR